MTPSSLRRRVVEDERGMTLVEVLVAVMAGVVVIMAAYGALTAAMRLQTRTVDRIDAVARGRGGMERITRDLRSQQCLDSQTPAMIWAADTGMEFYASVAAESVPNQPVERRRLEWIKDTGTFKDGAVVGDIIETVWGTNQTQPPYTFNVQKRRVVVAEDVEQDVSGGKTLPIFQYYGYDPGKVGRPSATPFPLVAMVPSSVNTLGRGVASANIGRIVLIDVRYLSRPQRLKVTAASAPPADGPPLSTVPFFNRVAVRTADPSDPMRSPLCL